MNRGNRQIVCRLYTTGILTMITLFGSIEPVLADTIEERLPYLGESVQESIVAFSDEGAQIVPASLNKTPEEIRLSPSKEINGAGAGTLVAGVVVLADGTVHSTALHAIGDSDLKAESINVAQAKEAELRERVTLLRERTQSLETELAAVNLSVKKAAGLDEVDANYAKAKELEVQATAEQRAIALLLSKK